MTKWAEARAHSVAPVRRGHPAYDYMNDGDGVVGEQGDMQGIQNPSIAPEQPIKEFKARSPCTHRRMRNRRKRWRIADKQEEC